MGEGTAGGKGPCAQDPTLRACPDSKRQTLQPLEASPQAPNPEWMDLLSSCCCRQL